MNKPSLILSLVLVSASAMFAPATLGDAAKEPTSPPSRVKAAFAPSTPAEPDGLARQIATELAQALRPKLAVPKPVAARPGEVSDAVALAALKARVGRDFSIHLRPENGTVAQIRGEMLERAAQGPAKAGLVGLHERTARNFLRENRAILRLENPDEELKLTSQFTEFDKRSRLRFEQTLKSVPVWPAGLSVHFDAAGNVSLLDGAYVPTPNVETRPTIASEQALARAKASVPGGTLGEAEAPVLIIYAPLDAALRLAWRVDLTVGPLQAWRLVVDALDGRVLRRNTRVYDQNVPGSGVDLAGATRPLNTWRSADGRFWLADTSKRMFNPASDPIDKPQGVITIAEAREVPINELKTIFTVRSDSPTTWANADAVSAAFNFSQTYDYFLDRHGRNSLDGTGGNITAVVRIGNYNNASWNGNLKMMFFGSVRPYAGALDVVGHELAHGVTEHSAGLVYENQPGALNESFSDIFGEMVEARARGQNDWLLGSDLGAGGDRNLRDPAQLTIPGMNRPYPKKMSEFVQLPNTDDTDHGGVHLNSSIVNHAFYLLAAGLPGAIGINEAERIFYRALTAHLQAQSQFVDCRLAAIASAEEIFGKDSTQARKTAEAFDAVEIFAAPETPEPTPVPVVQGPDSLLFVWTGLFGDINLGRRETAQGDDNSGSALADNVRGTRPAITGDGTIALFVSSDFDICLVETANANSRRCLGFAGAVHSVAISPNGKFAAFVLRDQATGQPDGKITLLDFETEQPKIFNLVAPAIDGVAVDHVTYADAMTFSTDSSELIYDALSSVSFGGGGKVERWSIFSLDIGTETTRIIVPPAEGVDTGNPSMGRAGNRYLTFDARRVADARNLIVVLDLHTGQAAEVGSVQNAIGYPTFTGDESAVIYTSPDPDALSGFSLVQQNLAPDRLQTQGAPSLLYRDAGLGVLYRRGAFSGTNALPTVTLTAAPVDAPAPASIALAASAQDSDGAIAKVEFYNGAGKLGEATAPVEGQYRFTWNNAPAGNYRLVARAIDNLGGASDSPAVNVTVRSGNGEPPAGQRASLAAARLANGAIQLNVKGPAGEYIVQQSTDLVTWADIYPLTIGPNGSGSLDDSGGPANSPILFYRMKRN